MYFKPTDAHTYLKYDSSHPPTCKNSIPHSQLLHLRRICSDESDFQEKSSEMTTFFQQRGYPQSVLNAAHSRVEHITQDQALQPADQSSSERIPLVLTFHPFTAKISKIVRQNLNILQADSTTRRIFPEPPLCAYRRDTSLRDQLVHSSLPGNLNISVVEQSEPCKRPRCKTCVHLIYRDSITGPNNQTFVMKNSFSCTTTNVVYAISCTKCNLIYIGETKRKIADRFREHLLSINKQIERNEETPGLPVANHFGDGHHDKNDIKVYGVLAFRGSEKIRKDAGMNISFTAFKS